MKSSKEVRREFIDFFITKGHEYVPSSPVVPIDDPTLLFANAGMNQFKNIFLGLKETPTKRAVNSQKCIRAGGKHNDLEDVGKDGYHQTFFEMLGNWSFGDYYKKEAIQWAWELLTELWQLPKDRLYATVHTSDSEAFELWKLHTDIQPEHISYHGDKDNFWEMGDTGPCGPCSEIHFDRGDGHCDKTHLEGHVCAVNGDCARYIELWNLVFIQYNREKDRTLTPLKSKYVDTGAGFERIVQVLQDKYSNYETDLFQPIIDKIAVLSGVAYDPSSGVSHRVIADHVRCLCFALADGGFPSNEGRGYVLRRILRRAARHGRLLGFAEPFMFHLVETVVGIMGHHFPELNGKDEYIRMVIKAEEERFNSTLDKGLALFEEICGKMTGKQISGKDVFLLYDTYGFPLDLTLVLAEEKGLEVDTEGFEAEMNVQRERARQSARFTMSATNSDWIEFLPTTPTRFVGYTSLSSKGNIQRYRFSEDAMLHLQLDQSPFYAESGGQVGDTGSIGNDAFSMQVTNVIKADDTFIHIGKLTSGSVLAGEVTCTVDETRRKDIARNHTATHLLHKALRSVLGEHVQQKGSLVDSGYLRFDFTHLKGMQESEIRAVEELVNVKVWQNLALRIDEKDLETARAEGAMALFGEKYGDKVRVVSVEGFSQELCGGTHVQATGEIGLFKIISESSSAAGIRRIEALTGKAAYAWVQEQQNRLHNLAQLLHVPLPMLENKISSLQEQNQLLEQRIKQMDAQSSGKDADDLLSGIRDLGDFKLLTAEAEGGAEKLRELGDLLKEKAKDAVSVLFAVNGEKISIACVIGTAIASRFHAGKIVSAIAAKLNGKGGGRPDSAMAGGSDPSLLPALLQELPELIRSTV